VDGGLLVNPSEQDCGRVAPPRAYPHKWVEALARAEVDHDCDDWDDPSSGAAKAEEFRESYRDWARAGLAALDKVGALVPAARGEQYLAELDTVLRPIKDLLQMVRMGVETQFNPPMTAIALEYGKVLALAAIAASGTAVPGEVLETAIDRPPTPPAEAPPATGLIVPTGLA
jgi:hypothetical protein